MNGAGGRSAPLWLILTLLLGAHPIAADLYLPALPDIAAAFGGRVSTVQWTLTIYILAFGVAQLFVGKCADRYGRRKLILAAFAVSVAASALAAAVTSLTLLVACRAMQGAAAASCAVCARAVIRDRFSDVAGTRVMAQSMSGMGCIALMAPLAGGLSTSIMGWHGTLGLIGVFGGAAWLTVYLGFQETHAVPAQATAVRASVFLKSPQFVASSLLAGASFSGAICFLLVSPFIFIGQFGMSRMAYGMVVAGCSLSFLIGTVLCRRYLRHASVTQAVRLGAGLSLGGGLIELLLWSAGVHAPWALIAPQCLFMLGHGFHQPCGQAGAVGPFPAAAGQAAALSGFLLTAVAFVTGQLALASTLGPTPTLIAAMSAMSAMIAINGWYVIPRAYRRPRQ